MKKLLRAYKVEIKPTLEQKMKINQSIGICRYLYNFYLGKNRELYQQYKDGLTNVVQKHVKRLYVMQKQHIKSFLKVNLNFQGLKRRINQMLSYIFLKIIKGTGKYTGIK